MRRLWPHMHAEGRALVINSNATTCISATQQLLFTILVYSSLELLTGLLVVTARDFSCKYDS
jgi:hypothetical protein